VGKVNPPEEIGLTLSLGTMNICSFHIIKTIRESWRENLLIVIDQCSTAIVSRNLSRFRTRRPNMYYGKEF